MTKTAREVLELALTLPAEERARVAQLLCDSLDAEASPAAEEAWREEILRRLDDVAREGERYGSWDDALALAERRLLELRSGKRAR